VLQLLIGLWLIVVSVSFHVNFLLCPLVGITSPIGVIVLFILEYRVFGLSCSSHVEVLLRLYFIFAGWLVLRLLLVWLFCSFECLVDWSRLFISRLTSLICFVHLGVPCLVSVVHLTSKYSYVYTSSLPSGRFNVSLWIGCFVHLGVPLRLVSVVHLTSYVPLFGCLTS